MSNVINGFLANIKTQTTIPQGFRDSIYPSIAPDSALPVIVYEYTDGVRESLYKDSFGLRTTTVALNLYSLNYDDLVRAREALETIYNGSSMSFGADATAVDVQRIVMNDAFFAIQDGNDKVYRCTIEFDLIT